MLDKWGRASAPVIQTVTTQVEPTGNNPPTVVFTPPNCTGRTCAVSAAGTTDTDGGIRNYTWTWGDQTADTVTTGTGSSHTYAAEGTFTITLVVTDNWGRITTATREVTIP